ncbi:hypothetical protein [Lichenicoccus sp.]|uniref:hypothetical protein n=1 Tax=Lichenicoccus sp. TaxID=2781899 RepID=UPI003D11EE33
MPLRKKRQTVVISTVVVAAAILALGYSHKTLPFRSEFTEDLFNLILVSGSFLLGIMARSLTNVIFDGNVNLSSDIAIVQDLPCIKISNKIYYDLMEIKIYFEVFEVASCATGLESVFINHVETTSLSSLPARDKRSVREVCVKIPPATMALLDKEQNGYKLIVRVASIHPITGYRSLTDPFVARRSWHLHRA